MNSKTTENHHIENNLNNALPIQDNRIVTSMARLNNLPIRHTRIFPISNLIVSKEKSENNLVIDQVSQDHIQDIHCNNNNNNSCSSSYPIAQLSQSSNHMSNVQPSPDNKLLFRISTQITNRQLSMNKEAYTPSHIQMNHFIIMKGIKKSCALPLCICAPCTLPLLCAYYICCPGCYLCCRQCHRYNHCKLCCYNPPKAAILENYCSKKIFWCPEKYCFDKVDHADNLINNCCYTHVWVDYYSKYHDLCRYSCCFGFASKFDLEDCAFQNRKSNFFSDCKTCCLKASQSYEINYDCQTCSGNLKELGHDIKTDCLQYCCFGDVKKIISDICCPINKSSYKKQIMRKPSKLSEIKQLTIPQSSNSTVKNLSVQTIEIHAKGINRILTKICNADMNEHSKIQQNQLSTESSQPSHHLQSKKLFYYKNNRYNETNKPSLFKLATLRFNLNTNQIANNNDNTDINNDINHDNNNESNNDNIIE